MSSFHFFFVSSLCKKGFSDINIHFALTFTPSLRALAVRSQFQERRQIVSTLDLHAGIWTHLSPRHVSRSTLMRSITHPLGAVAGPAELLIVYIHLQVQRAASNYRIFSLIKWVFPTFHLHDLPHVYNNISSCWCVQPSSSITKCD